MKTKPVLALYWCSSCGGCEESVIDLAEELPDVAARADIVFWPVAMDFKLDHVSRIEEGGITASLINGAIRTDEQEEMVRLLRRKSRLLIAHGTCAHLGGVVGLANFFSGNDLIERSYGRSLEERDPERALNNYAHSTGPELFQRTKGFRNKVSSLRQVVDVDYFIPGCPPTPELMKNAITMILDDTLPERGEVLAGKKALCDTCPRAESRPKKAGIREFKRLITAVWDPERCFLDQGIICLGPATRDGCGARCIMGNMPCRGCFGPTENVKDQGAKSLSFLSSMINADSEEKLVKIMDSVPDPAGLFYRYSLPSSILKGRAGRRRK